jgi:hypothetical protein
MAFSQGTTACFAVFCADLAMGMPYQMKSEITASIVNIKPVAKTFIIIKLHFFFPL